MSYQPSSFDCTSANFEKAALNRFRSLAPFLCADCQIYREPWDCSAVVCLDFIDCPDGLETATTNANLLVNLARELGIGNTIIFKMGHKMVGWRRLE